MKHYFSGPVIVLGGKNTINESSRTNIEYLQCSATNNEPCTDFQFASTKNTLPFDGFAAAAHHNEKIYLCKVLSKKCYIASTQQAPLNWTAVVGKRNSRVQSAVVVRNNIWFVYKHGIQYYSTKLGKFRLSRITVSNFPDGCLASNGDIAYMIGVGSSFNEIYKNIGSPIKKWIKVTTHPELLSKSTCLWYGNKVYVTGMKNGTKFSNKFLIFDTTTETITKKADLPNNRVQNGIIIVNNTVTVTGGIEEGKFVTNSYSYSEATDSWSDISLTLLTPRRLATYLHLPGN